MNKAKFTDMNTYGYSAADLAALNAAFDALIAVGLDYYDDFASERLLIAYDNGTRGDDLISEIKAACGLTYLVLCRSDTGDGGWSLHAPGSTDEDIATGDAPCLVSGPSEYDHATGAWSRPNDDDYSAAHAALRARGGNMSEEWKSVKRGCTENPGVWDTGNGAIRYVEENSAYPFIERVTVRSYCGRTDDNCRYYRLSDDSDTEFDTIKEAYAALRARQ